MEMASRYLPKEIEERIYKNWLEKEYFKAHIDKQKKPFTVMMPPPNITGQLHMGHALDDTIQDIFTRFHRMKGDATLWVPGTDHAAIATEAKVVAKLKEEGIDKRDLGREKFLERSWEWKKLYGGKIINQVKKLGCSCDFSRERFTMDESLSNAVKKVFIDLYNNGLIYRSERIVNWCPYCRTSISDIEVNYEEEQGNFYHIRYKIEGSEDYVVVATTRPETMLGDTAVAVNEKDDRYKHLIGKNVILPIIEKPIHIVGDFHADMEFGTGVVKITPAHDPNDFEVGKRHNLDLVNILNEDATLNENAGKYQGLDRYEARKKIVEELKEIGALEKIEPHMHNVGKCYRCNTIVEPYASKQWFVKMETLAKPAVDAVKNKEVKFIPDRFEKIYLNWMENIHDWCISRQIWWGHRIPAYHCKECGHFVVSENDVATCEKCGKNMYQDEDTLDTWFSSALWPFSTLGWPENTEDFEFFFPTSMLVTAYDIITFWVSKMIFSSLYFTKKVPFDTVFIHGIVRDKDGRKMSKSLGNGIDPLVVIDEYGTDALRFSLIQNISPGNDIRYIPEKVEASRNFANKLWNAARFANMYISKETEESMATFDIEKLEIEDKWILDKLSEVITEVTRNIESFEIGIALQKIYEFIWNDVCDNYIEMIKPRLYDTTNSTYTEAIWNLNYVLINILKLLHPYMPYITEEIYTNLVHEDESIMISKWPEAKYTYAKERNEVDIVIEMIKQIRNLRANANVQNNQKVNAKIYTKNIKDAINKSENFFKKLALLEEVEIIEDISQDLKDYTVIHMDLADIYLDMSSVINKEEEILKLEKEKEVAQNELKRATNMLANEKFVSSAPEKNVQAEREKVDKYTEMIQKITERIESLK